MTTLAITNRTITLGSTVYQVSNITSVGKYRIRPRYFFGLGFTIICGVLGYFGIQWAKENPDLKWFAGVAIALAALGILE